MSALLMIATSAHTYNIDRSFQIIELHLDIYVALMFDDRVDRLIGAHTNGGNRHRSLDDLQIIILCNKLRGVSWI